MNVENGILTDYLARGFRKSRAGGPATADGRSCRPRKTRDFRCFCRAHNGGDRAIIAGVDFREIRRNSRAEEKKKRRRPRWPACTFLTRRSPLGPIDSRSRSDRRRDGPSTYPGTLRIALYPRRSRLPRHWWWGGGWGWGVGVGDAEGVVRGRLRKIHTAGGEIKLVCSAVSSRNSVTRVKRRGRGEPRFTCTYGRERIIA